MKTNLEKWEATGLLVELPEDKKIKIAHWFQYALDKLLADETVDRNAETLVFPIIRKIAMVVDITTDDIDQIMIYINTTFKSRMESLISKCGYMNNIYYECELTAMYSDEKINEIQNRNKNDKS